MGKFFIFLLIISVVFFFSLGCTSTRGPYTPSKHMKYYRETYHPSVERADDIQYRGAYKYDIKGKKYRKYYKKQEKRDKKNK